MHHADPSGVFQPRRVGLVLECSTGELLARAAFMHHDNQGHDALLHHAVLKGLSHAACCVLGGDPEAGLQKQLPSKGGQ